MIRQNRSLTLFTAMVAALGSVAQAAHINTAFDTSEMNTYMLIAEDHLLLSNYKLGSAANPGNMAVTKQGLTGAMAFNDTSIQNMEIIATSGIGLRVSGDNDVVIDGLSTIKDSGGFNIPVTFEYGFGPLNGAIDVAKTALDGYHATATWDMGVDYNVGAVGGTGNAMNKILVDTTYTVVGGGLHVIDIVLDGSSDELLINSNSTLTIDAPADATVIFRIADGNKLQLSNAMMMRSGGIQGGSVLFYSSDDSTDNTFNVNNAYLDCVAFWNIYDDTLDGADKIRFNDVTGSTQLLANQIDLQNINTLDKCEFSFEAAVPEPSTLSLLALGCIAALGRRRS